MVSSSFFSIIFTFAAVIAGLGVIAIVTKLTGTDAYIIAAVVQFIDILKRVVQFVIDNLPRPVKIMLFLILFGVLGGVIYKVTVGATIVCYEGDVQKIGYTEGLAQLMIPTDEKEGAVNDLFGDVNRSDYVNYDCTELRCNEISFTAEQIEGVLNSDGNIVQVVKKRGEDGSLYDVTYTVAPASVINSLEGRVGSNLRSLSLMPTDVAFRDFFSGQSQVYNICYSSSFDTCLLLQQKTRGADVCGSSGFSEFVTAGLKDDAGGSINGWTRQVGEIRYYYNKEDGTFEAVARPAYGNIFSNLYALVLPEAATKSLDDCQTFEDADVVDSATQKLYEKGGVALTFVADTWFTPNRSYSFPVYNAKWSLLKSVEIVDANGKVVEKVILDTQQEAFDRAVGQRELDLNINKFAYVQNANDIVKYYCNEETEDTTDTFMTVAGINPFNKTVMLIFVLIGVVLGIYGYLGVNR